MNIATRNWCRYISPLLLLGAIASNTSAASLYVTSDTALDPMATTCTLGAPCHIDDAIRIAESNGADDTVILVGPSTFIGSGSYIYYPQASDLDRDFGIRVDGGAGLFDGNGGSLVIALTSRHGDLSISGVEIRNSSTNYFEDPAYLPQWNSALSFDSTSGDVVIDDVTVWNNSRHQQTFGAQAVAGVRARTTGSVIVEDSLFLNNTPGALRIESERATLRDNNFLANQVVSSDGAAQGAVRLDASTVDIEGNNFSGNACIGPGYAAALSVIFSPLIPSGPVNSRIVDNRFLNNAGKQCSGGIYLDGSRHTIGSTFITRIEVDRNLLARNRATNAPGAGVQALMKENTRLLVRNNVVYDNETLLGPDSGSTDGSAIHATTYQNAQLHLINNTITDNPMAANASGAVHINAGSYDSLIDVYNNIIWDNPTTVGSQADSDLYLVGDINASVTIRNNDYFIGNVFGGSSSNTLDVADNLNSVPGFVNAPNEDFHLDAGSTLIDAGSAQPTHLPSTDIDDQNRLQSTGVDIGADEFSGVARRWVTMNKTGSGDGSVSSIPSGLACGVGCVSNSAQFDDGTTVGFLAVADSASTFIGWSGDCGGTSSGTQLVVSGPHTCAADFQPRVHRIVITAAGPQTGSIGSTFGPPLNWNYSVGGTQRVVEGIPPGTDVAINGLIGDPMAGHVFLDDCEAQGGVASGQATSQATCSFSNIQQDHAMRVNFNSGVVLFPGRGLSITKSGLGDGTVTSTPAGIDCGGICAQDFFFNTDVSLVATPDAQSIFVGWSGDCPAGSSSVVITMDAAKTCDAEFIPSNTVIIGLGGNGSGNLSDNYRGTGTRYPQLSTQYTARYPFGVGVLFQANGNDSTVSFAGCDDATQGMVLTGNGTSNASCSIGSLTRNVNLSVTYAAQQSTLIVRSSGTGSGSVGTNVGGIGYSYPGFNTEQTSPITHGSNVLISASGGSGSTVHWADCTGPGASIIGEGTSSSSCQIGIYQATIVNVEFRGSGGVGSVFKDGFE